MKIQFIASVGIISQNPGESQKLFIDTLGLPLQAHSEGEYVFSEKIEGSKHFGVWPLAEAAQACFGTSEWPKDRPIPQTSVEFEVEDEASVADAAKELREKGYELLHDIRTEPWG